MLEGRLCKEEMSHRKSSRGVDLEAGLCARKEEVRELEARVGALSEEASKLRTALAKGERCDASRTEEVRVLRH